MSNQQYDDRNSFMGPIRGAIDITPAGTDLTISTRAVMVSDDDITITGILEGDTLSSTTFPLKAGIMYPLAYKRISAVSAGTVKGYY